MQKLPKIYVYVDETGQDTKGQTFIVCSIIVITEDEKNKLEDILCKIEKQSGKFRKWHRTSLKIKIQYLERILQINQLSKKIFIKKFFFTKAYYEKTLETIKDTLKYFDYQTSVITIDGIPETQELKTAIHLRKLGLKVKKVRGLKDKQSALLRLSDAIVGLSKDYLIKIIPYSKKYYPLFKDRGFLIELK